MANAQIRLLRKIQGYGHFSIITVYYIAMITTPEDTIPEIGETEEDKHFSIGQLKHHYLQIARQKFQGKVFTAYFGKK